MGIPIKLEGWPKLLEEMVAIGNTRSFEWGKHDCLCFAADCVHAMRGVDPLAIWRGKWSTREEAYRLLHKEFRGDFCAMVDSGLGPRLGSPSFVQRGDVAVIDTPYGLGLAVCIGRYLVAPAAEKGLTYKPLSAAIACWKV